VPEPKVAPPPINSLNSGAAKVIILDDLSVSYNWNIPNLPNILFVKGSITNDNDLKHVFHKKSTYIFHLEAFFANQNSADFPEKDLMVGQLETTKLLEHCLLLRGAKQFVYADSGCAIF
jgi:nucleoside-diphosphate-sugar epimerase